MVFEEREKWKSVIARRSMASEKSKKKRDTGRRPSCSGEEDVKHITEVLGN
jgi:hypothetical protein